MSQYYGAPPANQYGGGAPTQNLQFYSSSYPAGVSPQGAGTQPYGYGAPPSGPGNYGFGGAPGVSGRMGEQGGLRTGWLAAFSTEGYDGEPPLLEELGVNWGHIQMKVRKTRGGYALVRSFARSRALYLS
jgi:protein YIPF5/7